MAFLDNSETLKESQTLEFKEAAAGLPDDIWESYSAFANTEGGEIVLEFTRTRQPTLFRLLASRIQASSSIHFGAP